MFMKKVKVSIIGAGNVGSTLASILSQKGYADIRLIDIEGEVAKGKAIDISQQCAISSVDIEVIGGKDYSLVEDSQISVITAGIARKPGMKREDLLETNAKIVKEVVENLMKYSPKAYIIVVTNPVDAMSYLAYRVAGIEKNRVMGMGGVLDTARFKYCIREKLRCSYNSINAIVLGGHGDEMVPITSLTTIGGKTLSKLLHKSEIDEIVSKTKNGGAEIVNLLKTGSAYYAPAMAVAKMIESILFDKKEILPCSALCEGEYGINNLFFGVPVKLGCKGVEEIIELPLTKEEIELVRRSSESVKNTCKLLERLGVM
ncbi:MAG: malate dehydrogenase [Brevinematia bacterium]